MWFCFPCLIPFFLMCSDPHFGHFIFLVWTHTSLCNAGRSTIPASEVYKRYGIDE
jgi:hypothetical protein